MVQCPEVTGTPQFGEKFFWRAWKNESLSPNEMRGIELANVVKGWLDLARCEQDFPAGTSPSECWRFHRCQRGRPVSPAAKC
jgi:hypothetical protein